LAVTNDGSWSAVVERPGSFDWVEAVVAADAEVVCGVAAEVWLVVTAAAVVVAAAVVAAFVVVAAVVVTWALTVPPTTASNATSLNSLILRDVLAIHTQSEARVPAAATMLRQSKGRGGFVVSTLCSFCFSLLSVCVLNEMITWLYVCRVLPTTEETIFGTAEELKLCPEMGG
jgi:hypothetical protein